MIHTTEPWQGITCPSISSVRWVSVEIQFSSVQFLPHLLSIFSVFESPGIRVESTQLLSLEGYRKWGRAYNRSVSAFWREVMQPSETTFWCLIWPLAVWPSARNFTSLSYDFLTSKMGEMKPNSWGYCEEGQFHGTQTVLPSDPPGVKAWHSNVISASRDWVVIFDLFSTHNNTAVFVFCFFASALFSAPCCRWLLLALVWKERFL